MGSNQKRGARRSSARDAAVSGGAAIFAGLMPTTLFPVFLIATHITFWIHHTWQTHSDGKIRRSFERRVLERIQEHLQKRTAGMKFSMPLGLAAWGVGNGWGWLGGWGVVGVGWQRLGVGAVVGGWFGGGLGFGIGDRFHSGGQTMTSWVC